MNRRFQLGTLLLALFVAVAVGILSYNAGVSHGLAIAPVSTGGPPPAAVPYVYYRPWGWGWAFAPLWLLFFWFFVFRMFLWGGWSGRGWYYRHGWRTPEAFDEWHRRAHEQMNKQA